MNLIHTHLDLFLRAAATIQLAVAILNLSLVRILGWKQDLARLPLLVREVFHVHGWFISLTLAIFAALTWRFAGEIAHGPSEIARWVAATIGIFWAVRTVVQWAAYSSVHWRGKPRETAIHWMLFVGYGAFAIVYFLAAF